MAQSSILKRITEVTQESLKTTQSLIEQFTSPEITFYKVYKYCPLEQWFSNFTVHTKQLGNL